MLLVEYIKQFSLRIIKYQVKNKLFKLALFVKFIYFTICEMIYTIPQLIDISYTNQNDSPILIQNTIV